MNNQGKIGSMLLTVLTRPLAVLPLKFHRACGRFMGRVAGRLIRYRRDVVMTNLSRSFPEKKYDELQDICDKFYMHLGKIFAEAVWFGASSYDRLRKAGIVTVTNTEVVNDLYDKGKSVFVMCSHNGNWELYGGYASYGDFKFAESDTCMVYKKQASPTWDRFLNRNRLAPIRNKEAYGGLVETFSIVRYVYRHKDRPKLYNFITDQYPYTASSKVRIDSFMNQPVWSMDGAPALARHFGMSVVYLNMREKEDGNYELTFTPICEDASEYSTEDILKRYYTLLEKDIREQPYNYLWTHKRWK